MIHSGGRIEESCPEGIGNEGGREGGVKTEGYVYIQMRPDRNGGLLFAWKFGVWVLHWARECFIERSVLFGCWAARWLLIHFRFLCLGIYIFGRGSVSRSKPATTLCTIVSLHL